jgi:dolichol-phosphate mannosyltransferase
MNLDYANNLYLDSGSFCQLLEQRPLMAQTVQPQDFSVQRIEQKETISLVMPIYNLENEVDKISTIANLLEKRLEQDFELIVVDDGSTDNTFSLLQRLNIRGLKVIGYQKNMGKGAALMYGCTHTKGNIVIFMDGDLQAIPNDIQNYVDALDSCDIVLASKRLPGSYLKAGLKRKFLSIGFNLLVRILTPLSLSDTQVGFKAFRRTALDRILPLLSVKRYAFDVELLTVAKLLNLKMGNCLRGLYWFQTSA